MREKPISGLSVTGVQKENKGPATTHFLETMNNVLLGNMAYIVLYCKPFRIIVADLS